MAKKKIKILIVTSANFPFGGSSANYIRLLSLGLRNNADSVKVLLPLGHSYGRNVEEKIKRKGHFNGVEYKYTLFLYQPHSLAGKLINAVFGNFFLFLNLLYFRLVHNYKIIINYDAVFIRDISVFTVAKISNIKLISVIPDFFEKPKKSVFSWAFLKWANFFWGLKYVAKHADKLIVFSSFLKDFFENEIKFKKPLLVIPNLTDPDNFIKAEQHLPEIDTITIGFLGSPTQKDGVFDLIDSFKIVNSKYKNTHLICIGDLTNGTSVIPGLVEYAKKLNLSDAITFTGLVSFKNVPELLNKCHIFVLARPDGIVADAGFPSKLGEYFACKKPVVLTEVGGVKNYFQNKVNVVLAEPGNILSIASGIEYLIENPSKAIEIGNEGYNWMIANLEYTNVTKKIMGFIINS